MAFAGRDSARRIVPRFSLRSLLVLVTLCGVLTATVGVWYQRAREQRRVVERLSALGASIGYDQPFTSSVAGGVPARTWRQHVDQWLAGRFGKDAVYNVTYVRCFGKDGSTAAPLVRDLRSLNDLQIQLTQSDFEATWETLCRCVRLKRLTVELPSDGRLNGITRLSKLESLSIHQGVLTREDVEAIASLPRLKSLYLTFVRTSDDALEPMSRMTNLREFHFLYLGKSQTITTRGVAFVGQMPHLRNLTLANLPLVDDQVCHYIAPLTQLESLNLDQAGLRGRNLDQLTGLSNLTKLHLMRTNVDDSAMLQLAKVKSLVVLDLASTKVTDAGMAPLASLTNLEKLHLSELKLSGETLSSLNNLELRELYLMDCPVSDAAIEHLSQLKSLREIQLLGTRVSPEGRLRLKQLLPACGVY